MKIIVGLGNPGRRYDATPHNVGFQIADELARRWSLSVREDRRVRAEVGEGRIAGDSAMLVKPQTFMNLSGEAVAALTRQRELAADDLLVITDDVDLPIGRLRIRPRGSAGTHNGLKSIVERLGSQEFARLRIGIQPPWAVDDLADYVLSKLPPLERGQLQEMIAVAADAAESWVREGSGPTADRFNGQRLFKDAK